MIFHSSVGMGQRNYNVIFVSDIMEPERLWPQTRVETVKMKNEWGGRSFLF